jgi:cell division protease FtsH
VKGRFKTLLIWLGLGVICLVVAAMVKTDKPSRVVPFTTFLSDVREGGVSAVEVNGNEIIVHMMPPGQDYATRGALDPNLATILAENDVDVQWKDESSTDFLVYYLVFTVILFVFLYLFFRRAKGGMMTDILSLGKSRGRLVGKESTLTFQDVGGCQEAKELLGDVVDFLKNPQRWNQAGARLPRGVLLEGPPGCGKTLLARAVAGETNARFYTVSASEFVEMFVGVGAARVRDLFETAAKQPPAIVFIDELDAVGRRRGSGVGSAHDEREQTLNQLLVCLDGFTDHKAVVVLAATNRPDILDQALLRPGRFDRRVRVPSLSRDDRRDVLRVHTKSKPLAEDVSFDELADSTEGYNGAELENLANEAALAAVRRASQENGDPPKLRMDDFRRAIQAAAAHSRTYDKLDAVLIESNTQLAEPTGRAVVRVRMVDEAIIEGEVVWANASFLKLREKGGSDIVLAKSQIHQIASLAGTDAADRDDIKPDAWAARPQGLA